MSFTLFGLTGGVASGKSTVARRFAARGLPVIDADQVARDVVLPGTEGLEEVVAAFGAEVRDAQGGLDRKALGRIVFGDAQARRRLEAILHPRIAQETRCRAEALTAEGHTLACYEAALLVENGMHVAFRPLVVVAAPREVQLSRLQARDDLSAEEAEARVASQLPLAEKVAVADHVIDNVGDLEALLRRADEVLDTIAEAVGHSPLPQGEGR